MGLRAVRLGPWQRDPGRRARLSAPETRRSCRCPRALWCWALGGCRRRDSRSRRSCRLFPAHMWALVPTPRPQGPAPAQVPCAPPEERGKNPAVRMAWVPVRKKVCRPPGGANGVVFCSTIPSLVSTVVAPHLPGSLIPLRPQQPRSGSAPSHLSAVYWDGAPAGQEMWP